jgi:hypothetical protein
MPHRNTSRTVEAKTQERNILENTSKWQLYERCQLAKFLSYHPSTAVQLCMVFSSIASNIMNWPFFLDFVLIDNDDEEETEVY